MSRMPDDNNVPLPDKPGRIGPVIIAVIVALIVLVVAAIL
jgi:hypothetical protein